MPCWEMIMSRITVCKADTCVGCNACVNICNRDAISIIDDCINLNAVIDTKKCINCGLCKKVCQQNNMPLYHKPIAWYQGWANDEKTRIMSSSGGFASAVAYHCLDNGYSVYACSFYDGLLMYRKILNKSDFYNCIGSKYVKSDTAKTYREIREELSSSHKVLFIGLPCHVSGLKLFLGEKHLDNLITIDLICHRTSSIKLFNKYLSEKNVDSKKINNISFRQKAKCFPSREKGKFEYWLHPFLDGLTYTENCYDCKFARLERVSDITIGDSWGSSLDLCEKNKGISLVLCNTAKGDMLAHSIDFRLEKVDLEVAVNNNRQLHQPSVKPVNRDLFVKTFRRLNNYHKAVKKCYKIKIIKNRFNQTKIGKLRKIILRKKDPVTDVQITFVEEISLLYED